MRILVIILFLANIVFLFGSIPWWTKTGAPNELGFQIMLAVVFCVGFCILMGLAFVTMIFGKQSISDESFSTPNGEHMMSEATRLIIVRRVLFIQFFTELLCVVMLLCFLFAQWEFVQHCQNPAYNMTMSRYALNVLVIIFIADMIFLPLWFRFRLPKEKE
jgi:hypothetical protein